MESVMINDDLRQFFMMQRKTLLEQVDALERLLGMSPRTAEIRKEIKAQDKPIEVKLEQEKGLTNGNN